MISLDHRCQKFIGEPKVTLQIDNELLADQFLIEIHELLSLNNTSIVYENVHISERLFCLNSRVFDGLSVRNIQFHGKDIFVGTCGCLNHLLRLQKAFFVNV